MATKELEAGYCFGAKFLKTHPTCERCLAGQLCEHDAKEKKAAKKVVRKAKVKKKRRRRVSISE